MGGYSASASSSASAANKITTGPTTFGGISFAAQNAGGSNTILYIGLAIAAAIIGFLFLKK